MVFCHISTRISRRYIHVPSLPNLPPRPPSHLHPHLNLQPVTEPPFEFPESYSKFPLAICFTHGVVNFYVTLSINLPFSFLSARLVHRSVLYICFSIAALKRNSSVPSLQIPHIYVCVCQYMMFIFLLLTYFTLCNVHSPH